MGEPESIVGFRKFQSGFWVRVRSATMTGFDLAEGSCQMVKNLNDSNESIKSDQVPIVIKDYLRFRQTEVRSV
jgi:hypothetical protein